MNEIKSLREQAGLTQEEAADKCDINVNTFASYEQGRRTPAYDVMDKIRRVLGGEGRKVEQSALSTNTGLVKQYPAADAADTPTVTIDTRLIDADGDVPTEDQATAHYVQTYMMGVWMSDGWVLARNCHKIEGAGRWVVLWKDGDQKQVIEAMRHDDESVVVTYHHEDRKERFWEVEHADGWTVFERKDGSQITMQVLGRVIMPKPHGQQQSEKIQRSVESALSSLQLNGRHE